MKRLKLLGRTFSYLTVIEESKRSCLCQCDCGATKWILRSNLLAGYTKSCGCFHRLRTSGANTKHGHRRSDIETTPTYRSWQAMKARCSNWNKDHAARYVERGIKVCDRWKDFGLFLADMGVRPLEMELDRIDNNGDYEPGNCRWATHKENCQNR